MRIKFVVAYDGTDFRGWAFQAGQRTVQQTLTDAILRTTNVSVELTGASRTDSGAHARGQVCHFDSDLPIDPERWPRVLNRVLPADVTVVRSTRVRPEFHSRFCAEDRWYRYRIRATDRDPFSSRYVHDHCRPLDVSAMEEAAKFLVGEHDYRAFTEELQPHIENTVRKMRSVCVRRVGSEVWIDVVGTAFLRGMMRRMSGALLEVGTGNRPAATVAELLTDRRAEMHWPVVLPAKGLTLLRVRYGNPPKDCRASDEEAD